jgi:hypothetical protein
MAPEIVDTSGNIRRQYGSRVLGIKRVHNVDTRALLSFNDSAMKN